MRHSVPGAPVLWREQPDCGCVATPSVYLRDSEHVCGVEQKAGGEGCSEERGHNAFLARMGISGHLQAFCGRRVPQALEARPADHRGPRLSVWLRTLEWEGGVPRCGSFPCARCCAPSAPFARLSRAHNVRLPRDHGIASDDRRSEERTREVLRETPRQDPVRVRVLLRGTLQNAVHEAEGGHEVPAGTRGAGCSRLPPQ